MWRVSNWVCSCWLSCCGSTSYLRVELREQPLCVQIVEYRVYDEVAAASLASAA